MDRPVAVAKARTLQEAGFDVTPTPGGNPQLLPDESSFWSCRRGQRQHQVAAPPRPRIQKPPLSSAQGSAHGYSKNRIRRFPQSRLIGLPLHILVQSPKILGCGSSELSN